MAVTEFLLPRSGRAYSIAAQHRYGSFKASHAVSRITNCSNGGGMSDAKRLRKWAAQLARQSGEEPDAGEASRLLDIAESWVRLADHEEFNQPPADVGG